MEARCGLAIVGSSPVCPPDTERVGLKTAAGLLRRSLWSVLQGLLGPQARDSRARASGHPGAAHRPRRGVGCSDSTLWTFAVGPQRVVSPQTGDEVFLTCPAGVAIAGGAERSKATTRG
jgi:hypothetical protein